MCVSACVTCLPSTKERFLINRPATQTEGKLPGKRPKTGGQPGTVALAAARSAGEEELGAVRALPGAARRSQPPPRRRELQPIDAFCSTLGGVGVRSKIMQTGIFFFYTSLNDW